MRNEGVFIGNKGKPDYLPFMLVPIATIRTYTTPASVKRSNKFQTFLGRINNGPLLQVVHLFFSFSRLKNVSDSQGESNLFTCVEKFAKLIPNT